MPHAALIVGLGAAVVIGSVVAYETYRESKGEEPVMEGVKAGWNGFKSDLQRGLWDFRERMDGRDPEQTRREAGQAANEAQWSGGNRDRESQTEMEEVQRDIQDFEMHERQMSTSRQMWNEEINGTLTRRRKPLEGSGALLDDDEEESGQHRQLIDVAGMNKATTSQTLFDGFKVSRRSAGEIRSKPSTIVSDEDWYDQVSSSVRSSASHASQEDGNISDSWTQLETGSRSSDED